MGMKNQKLYWFGNVAKFEIANRIGAFASSSSKSIEIVDLGAGSGGDWDKIVSDNPRVTVHLWEPHDEYYEGLKSRFNGISRIHVHKDIDNFTSKFDLGTSLSVLEHVKNPSDHLSSIKRLLKPNGLFFMNFDDGHFRKQFAPKGILELRLTAAEFYRSTISRIIPRLVPTNIFQKRVSQSKLFELIAKSELEIEEIFFNHIGPLKSFVKRSGTDAIDLETMIKWGEFEEILSKSYTSTTSNDIAISVLWKLFSTRTFVLSKKSLN